MRQRTTGVGLVSLSLFAMACTDAGRPTGPRASAGEAAFALAAGGSERQVTILDACDPTTFNAVLGAGACTRAGGITLDRFNALLEQNGSVGAWHFSPTTLNAFVGQTIVATNRGGETHTFTEVEHFGGGFVEALNTASGNPIPAEECLNLSRTDFVPPGGIARDEIEEEGTELYQCCIHPWMRVTVHANHSR